jgi:hypothetical protein
MPFAFDCAQARRPRDGRSGSFVFAHSQTQARQQQFAVLRVPERRCPRYHDRGEGAQSLDDFIVPRRADPYARNRRRESDMDAGC